MRLKLNILKSTCGSGRGILKAKFDQVSRRQEKQQKHPLKRKHKIR